MKVTIYGAEICPDCVEAKEMLKKSPEIQVEYKNITESTRVLKEFLTYRDKDAIFDEVKEDGRIGIPFFILEDGTKTFDITPYITGEKVVESATKESIIEENTIEKNACSIDGKGC
ncbi:MAG: glutaredoxin-like protein [Anaerocolumna sp.]|nr:glutaredoxin-like protein [Anaerocolumna sp.]